jgi:CheY-like chemotaxis protein
MSAVRFLVADSSPALHTFVRKMLGGFGFEAAWVHTAHSADAALAVARDIDFHFLLTDCFHSDKLTGLDLAARLRATQPQLRWALMSDTLGPAMAQKAEHTGAMFQLRKPFSALEMQSAMGKALEVWGRDFDEVGRRMPGYRRPRHSGLLEVPIEAPAFKAGDQVVYNGTVDTVRNVIFSRGELSVQLTETPGVVAAHKLRKY